MAPTSPFEIQLDDWYPSDPIRWSSLFLDSTGNDRHARRDSRGKKKKKKVATKRGKKKMATRRTVLNSFRLVVVYPGFDRLVPRISRNESIELPWISVRPRNGRSPSPRSHKGFQRTRNRKPATATSLIYLRHLDITILVPAKETTEIHWSNSSVRFFLHALQRITAHFDTKPFTHR